VPQDGNTNLVGSMPDDTGTQGVLSLVRPHPHSPRGNIVTIAKLSLLLSCIVALAAYPKKGRRAEADPD